MEYRFQYGILEITNEMLRYQFCNMYMYVYFDIASLTVLALTCSIQAFMGRKLPTNFNEAYYIFLGMFTSFVLLLVSIPLDATFSGDGQKIFVNSYMYFGINISLLSITYGYKLIIILFQKHKNTRAVIQETTLKSMQQIVRKRTK